MLTNEQDSCLASERTSKETSVANKLIEGLVVSVLVLCIYDGFEFTANSVDDQKQLQPETIGAEAIVALRVVVLI